MSTIAEIRAQFPQYNDLDDATLVRGLHKKFYADMPFDGFAKRVGLASVEHAPGVTGQAGEGLFTADEQAPTIGRKGDKVAMTKFRPDGGTTILEGALLGFGDEVVAGLRAVPIAIQNYIKGEGPTGIGESYDQILARQRTKLEATREQAPIGALVTELGGALATGKVPAGLALKGIQSLKAMPLVGEVLGGSSLAAKAVRSAGAGAAYGGIQGFGTGEGGFEERASAVPASAALGSLFAVAAPAVGKGVGGVVNALWRKAIENPTVAMIEQASRKGYKAAEDAGLVFSPETYGRVVDDILEEARKRGIGKGDFAEITNMTNPTVTKIVEKLERTQGAATGLSYTDAEIMRRVAEASADPAAGMVARKFREMIDNAMESDFISGSVKKGVSGIKRGHDLRARMSRARVIDKAIEEAKNAPGANHTVAGYQTALQRKFSDIANSDEFKLWPKEEQEAVLRVVRGRTVENFLWAAGAFSPRGSLTGAAYGALLLKFPWLAVPLAAATTGSRLAATRMSVNSAKAAEALIKTGRKPLPAPQALIAQALAERAMIAQSGQFGDKAASWLHAGQ